MKILGASVHDPTTHGVLDRSMLNVVVDEFPDCTIEPENFAGGWTVGKWGPFVQFTAPTVGAAAGDFNVRFRNRFPPLVDIELEFGDEVNFDFALPLPRARQLMRKHATDWKYILSDMDAQDGLIAWVPVQTNAGCRHWLGREICGQRPARTVRSKNVDVPLCGTHVTAHNERHAAKRATAS